MPYIVSEFDAAGINFPYTFDVGDVSEPNDSLTSTGMIQSWQGVTWTALSDTLSALRWGESKNHTQQHCTHPLRMYVCSLEVIPVERRRRDASPNRQYSVFQSTQYATVNTAGELW